MFEAPLLIVGLGNPGAEYARARHNAGFMVVEKLATEIGATDWRHKKEYWYADGQIGDIPVRLVKSQTFMNRSGLAVDAALSGRTMSTNNTVVVYDDVEVMFGSWRVRHGGSTGGHNGLKSILEVVGSDDCTRVRVGIGPAPAPAKRPDYEGPRELDDYVLAKFDRHQVAHLQELLDAVVAYLITSVSTGVFDPATKTI